MRDDVVDFTNDNTDSACRKVQLVAKVGVQ